MEDVKNLDDIDEHYLNQKITEHKNNTGNEEESAVSKLSQEGYELLKHNNISDAKKKFQQLLDIDQKNPYALVGLGDVSRKEHESTNAINFYNKCLEFHHENKYATIGLADVYRDLGMYKKAIQISGTFSCLIQC